MENTENKTSERSQVRRLAKELYTGLITLEQVKEEYTEIYLMNKQLLDSAYRLYINDKVEPPKWRFNLILAGEGGTGKTTLANLIAEYIKEDTFTFTDIEAGFNEYLNQKIVIWDEMRSNFIKEWGINRFLTATNNGKYNTARIRVLYGVAKLGQNYNLITTSEPAKDFLTGLTERSWEDTTHTKLTAPENPDQISRRFNIYLDFHKEVIDKYTQKTKITLYEYNPAQNYYYVFTDKYEIIKEWEITTNEDNFEEQLREIAKVIAGNIKQKRLITENIK